jgi:hypothetical protein
MCIRRPRQSTESLRQVRHVPSAGRKPNWAAGFKVELWYWGFVVALLAFAMILKFVFFIVILVASICLLWISTSAFMKKTNAPQ